MANGSAFVDGVARMIDGAKERLEKLDEDRGPDTLPAPEEPEGESPPAGEDQAASKALSSTEATHGSLSQKPI